MKKKMSKINSTILIDHKKYKLIMGGILPYEPQSPETALYCSIDNFTKPELKNRFRAIVFVSDGYPGGL